MAIILDTTVSGSSSNGYITVSEYIQYWENKLIDLSSIENDIIKGRIIIATQFLEANYKPILGTKAVLTQLLQYPLSGAEYQDGQAQPSNIIIKPILDSVCELGEYYANDGDLMPESGKETTRERLDGVGEVEYKNSTSKKSRFFNLVDALLYGIIERKVSSSSNVNLYRS